MIQSNKRTIVTYVAGVVVGVASSAFFPYYVPAGIFVTILASLSFIKTK